MLKSCRRQIRSAATLAITILAIVGWASVDAVYPTYRDGPPLAHTGGFGEKTCRACHLGSADDSNQGMVQVHGLPDRFAPDSSYVLEIVLTDSDIGAAGFQIAIRDSSGHQYGRITHAGAGVQVAASESGIAYAFHTVTGTTPSTPGVARWRIKWTTPRQLGSAAVVSVAVNAANGDNSELGDRIYTASLDVQPAN